jgi:hypothetical protein
MKPYLHVREGKSLKFSSPNAFFAEKKEVVDEISLEILLVYTILEVSELEIL